MRRADKIKRIFSLLTGVLMLLVIAVPSYSGSEQIRLGILAYRGKENAVNMWKPTADYLASRLHGTKVVIVPLDFHEIDRAVRDSEIDFVIANTAMYVDLEARYGITRIATIENTNGRGNPTVFGGVIFCRTDRQDINNLADIKGKSFMAVDEMSLGGWLAARREFSAQGLDPFRDFRSVEFGMTHDAVINAVISGRVDAGTVRTDTLEHMAEAGNIRMNSFRILNPRTERDFHFVLSTRLYPEWPIAKLRHTSLDKAEMVVTTLIGMQHYGPEASAAKIKGWTIPLDYQPVHELMKELRVGPYREYGKVALSDIIGLYLYWIIAGIVLILLMALTTVYMLRLNRRLVRSEDELKDAKADLEKKVTARTEELLQTVDDLSKEVTLRKEREEEVIRIKDEWELTFDTVPDMIAIIDDQYRIVRANKAMAEGLGAEADLTGQYCYKSFHNMDTPPDFCPHAQLLKDGRQHSEEAFESFLNAHLWVTVTPFCSSDGKMKGSIHIARDISELKRAQIEIEESRAFLQAVIDNTDEATMVIGRDYRIELMNSVAKKLHLGNGVLPDSSFCYQVSHRRSSPCDGIDDPCPLQRVLKEKQSSTVSHRHFDSNGREMIVEILASPLMDENGEVVRIIETCRDITEKIRLEKMKKEMDESIRREQKEQSIITLAAGIAHDFNNSLMGVLGNAELLSMKMGSGTPEKRFATEIMHASLHMADLTSQLLAYAGGGRYQATTVALNNLIGDALNLSQRGVETAAEVITELDGQLCPVTADPSQMTQVFQNIFINAFEAMEKTEGKMTIRTYNELNRPAWRCDNFGHEHPAGDYAVIVVSDAGPGIPAQILNRIFDPFFTTKFLGRGLGLAAAAGIIHNHKGCISVKSSPGIGTSFYLYIPCLQRQAEMKAANVPSPGRKAADMVMIVEDEKLVLDLLQEMIKQMGYPVLPFMDSSEALTAFKAHKDSIRLAILDLQMPGIKGEDLFREMKTISPDLRVLISSGYDESTALLKMGEGRPDGFLKKPYTYQSLEDRLNELMKG